MPGTGMSFDALAADYDRDFTHTAIGQYLRGEVHERLLMHFPARSSVLEMGCGTGEDALFLAQHGVQVTATDASEKMLAVAREKTRNTSGVTFGKLDLRALNEGDFNQAYQGAFSNFGALNCLDDWRPLAAWLAARIQPGGKVCLGIMSPLCVWETAWHGLHLDFKVAFRRQRGSTFQADAHSEAIAITYPTVRHITRDFAPHFRRVYVRPLGVCVPPSDVYGVIEKRPRLLRLLLAAERRFGKMAALALFGDHYWIEFERMRADSVVK